MHTVDHLRWGLGVLKRALEVFVIWPSIALGGLFFAVGLTGESPFSEVVSIAHQWGDETFRNAPAGQVFVAVIPDRGISDEQVMPPSLLATGQQFRPIETQQALDAATAYLKNVYWMCVLSCAALMLVVLGPSKFFGRPPMVEQSKTSTLT